MSIFISVEEDLHSSFDAYQGFGRHSTNPMGGAHNASGTLGSHLSPNGAGAANGRTFADMHDVHYASNQNATSYQGTPNPLNSANYTHSSAVSLQGDIVPNFNVNATVHSQQHNQQASNVGSVYDNSGYRPETRTPMGMTNMGTISSHRDSGLPGKAIRFLSIEICFL